MRLGDALRRVLAGVFSRECGLVGPRSPEPPESAPEPVRASMLAWADGAVPVAIGLDPAGGLVQWMPPRVHRTDGREPLTVWIRDEVAGLYDGGDVWATLRGKADAMRSLRRMYGIDSMVDRVDTAHRVHLAKVNMAIRALGGRTNDNCGRRALPPSTLLRCIRCDCVLNNPAEWPVSLGFYRCAWCAAVAGDVAAARRLWGTVVVVAIEWAQRDGRPAPSFPPPNVVRRPVTAPTIECYPRGVR